MRHNIGCIGNMEHLLIAGFILLVARGIWGENAEKCNQRYLQHYKVKNCTPVYDEDPNCPVRFNCPKDYGDEANLGCGYRGKIYKLDEQIPVDDKCQKCVCNRETPDGILKPICEPVECPELKKGPLQPGCHVVEDQAECCPTIKCFTGLISRSVPCVHDGKVYKIGQPIDLKKEPCIECTCTDEWTGINGKGCKRTECDNEKDRSELVHGCLPIYHEDSCCPIDFFCGEPKEGSKNENPPTSSEIDAELTCSYKKVHYRIGHKFKPDYDICVTCTCSIPPDFTCLETECTEE